MGKRTTEKISGKVGTALSVLIFLILLPVILINITLITKTYTDPNHLPDVMGIKPVVVLSGSMSPTFEVESLIFVKMPDDPAALQVGDVICYMNNGTAITHRIAEVSTIGGQTQYITKGDANNTTDRLAVSPENVEGVYVNHWEKVGGIVMFMQTTSGMILFIVVPVILYLAFDLFRRNRESKHEKERAAQLEKQLLEFKKQDPPAE